jgi:hypothetical protein
MSTRAIFPWIVGGGALIAALVFQSDILLSSTCGIESGPDEPLLVYLEGRRRDMVADIVFGGEKWPDVGHTSFVPIKLEPGPPLDVAIAADTDLLVSVTGDTARVRHVAGIDGGGRIAVHGVPREKISFTKLRLCFARLAQAARKPSPRVHALMLPYDPPQDIPCSGLDCAATPIS